MKTIRTGNLILLRFPNGATPVQLCLGFVIWGAMLSLLFRYMTETGAMFIAIQ